MFAGLTQIPACWLQGEDGGRSEGGEYDGDGGQGGVDGEGDVIGRNG
jgi:hypothetical protein